MCVACIDKERVKDRVALRTGNEHVKSHIQLIDWILVGVITDGFWIPNSDSTCNDLFNTFKVFLKFTQDYYELYIDLLIFQPYSQVLIVI